MNNGVKLGMRIRTIDGVSVPNDDRAIHKQLDTLKKRNVPFFISFAAVEGSADGSRGGSNVTSAQ